MTRAEIFELNPAAPASGDIVPPHAQLFAFEDDFVASLRCIPMAVRFKLDRVGVKLTLRQWSRFTKEDRHRLLMRSCETPTEIAVWRAVLEELVIVRAGELAKPLPPLESTPWEDAHSIAPIVVRYAASVGAPAPTQSQWARLSVLQRFVLIKLTRDNHDNVNFLPALHEFGLVR